ncbi:MAG: ATP synthase F1 subunit gamma [bacterium]
MPSIKQLNTKLVSLKNTRKITKAMKMIAATRLRKAQEAIESSRPYAEELTRIMHRIAQSHTINHPLFEPYQEVKKVRIILCTSDRGLCGAYNSNIIKKALGLCMEKKQAGLEVSLSFLGKKGYDFFRKRNFHIDNYYADAFKEIDFYTAGLISSEQVKSFLDNQIQEVYLVYNSFKSAMSQNQTVYRLLPMSKDSAHHKQANVPYIYEPEPDIIIEKLVDRSVKLMVFSTMLNSAAGEHGARMTAMDAASTNCSELIDKYTIMRNRARQASITTELIEITSGAEALKG